MSIKVALACQGGGLHTAFTAGVLKKILAEKDETVEIIALSGTSAGALCALMVWCGLAQADGTPQKAIQKLENLWADFSAHMPAELIFNYWAVSTLRVQDMGVWPALKMTPYHPYFDWQKEYLRWFGTRPEFIDYERLLKKHVDLTHLDQTQVTPRLVVGAVEVMSGEFKAFDSRKGEISADAIRASGVIPWWGIKPIRMKNGPSNRLKLYWDGVFSQNPPIKNFFTGVNGDRLQIEEKPDEIWVIQVNPQSRTEEPRSVAAIEDRWNELVANLSLTQEIGFVKQVNRWLERNVLTSEEYKPIALRRIAMQPDLSDDLDTASKLDRSTYFVEKLMTHGEEQAETFLKQWQPQAKMAQFDF